MLTVQKVEKVIRFAQLLLLGFAIIRILKAEGGGGDDIGGIRPV